MKWFGKSRSNRSKSADAATPPARVVVPHLADLIDNTTMDDNWLVNEADIPVTVACSEMFGSFTIDLLPTERKRITFDVTAAPFRRGNYSYDDLRYSIGRGEEWAIRREDRDLVMVEISSQQSPLHEQALVAETSNQLAKPAEQHESVESVTFKDRIRVLNDAYLVQEDEELDRRVANDLDSIVNGGGVGFLLDWLYRDMRVQDGGLSHEYWGDYTWNKWLQKREVVRALARGRAEEASARIAPLVDASSDDAQFHSIMRPAVIEALNTLAESGLHHVENERESAGPQADRETIVGDRNTPSTALQSLLNTHQPTSPLADLNEIVEAWMVAATPAEDPHNLTRFMGAFEEEWHVSSTKGSAIQVVDALKTCMSNDVGGAHRQYEIYGLDFQGLGEIRSDGIPAWWSDFDIRGSAIQIGVHGAFHVLGKASDSEFLYLAHG